jgi:hypothetical protein
VLNYGSIIGNKAVDVIVNKMSIDEYDRLMLEDPEALVLKTKYRFAFLAKKPGRYMMNFNIVNSEEPSRHYHTERLLLIFE